MRLVRAWVAGAAAILVAVPAQAGAATIASGALSTPILSQLASGRLGASTTRADITSPVSESAAPLAPTRLASDPNGPTTTPRWANRASSGQNTYRIVDDLRRLPQALSSASVLGRQWAPQRLGAPALWDTARGSGVIVAVIDTGVDGNHPDLRGQVLPGAAFLGGSTTSLGNGWNDQEGHGTFLAGLIAAQDVTGQGVAGLAPGVKILPVRVFAPDGAADEADIATGVRWAAAKGARIINLSLGSPDKDTVLAVAIAEVTAKGVLVVASAGNAGAACTVNVAPDECGDPAMYPAADPFVLGVGATGRSDVRPDWSETGSAVDVVAPGVDVASTSPRGAYSSGDGTSFASPYVAAAAALLLERYPTLTPAQLQGFLMTTATDLGASGPDDLFGWGLVSPTAALTAAATGAVALPQASVVGVRGVPTRAFYDARLPIAGTVKLNSRPIPGVRLSVFVKPATSWLPLGNALTGDDGAAVFGIASRTAGVYGVAVTGSSVVATTPSALALLPSVTVAQPARGSVAMLRGSIAAPSPGGLAVILHQLVGSSWQQVAVSRSAASGVFVFPARAVGSTTSVYRVIVPAQVGLGAVATGAVYARR